MTQSDPADNELFQRMAEGDKQAFALLYRRYHQGLYNFLLKFIKIPSLAEDLVHDIFLKLWQSRAEIQISSSVSAYLYKMGRNRAIDQLRRVSREPSLQEEVLHRLSLGFLEEPVHQAAEWRNYEDLLRQAVAALPPQRREAFKWVRQEGKTYAEAADLMGISRNTLKQHLSLAVESIQGFLSEHGVIFLAIFVASQPL